MAFQFQGFETIQREAVVGTRHRPQERSYGGRPTERPPSRGRGPYRPAHARPPSANRRQDHGGGATGERLEAWKIFDVILQEYKGKAWLSEIRLLFPRSWSETEIKDWLEKDVGQRFSVFVDDSGIIKFVSVHCRARLCVYYGQGHCNKDDCPNFHYCRSFLAGHCKMGANCRHSHTFEDDHNQQLKRKLHLGKYNNHQMKSILKHSVLQVCSNYNGTGCKMEDGCSFLHVCKEFVMKECPNEDCTLEHSFEGEHTLRLLRTFKLSIMAGKNIHLLRKNILTRKDESNQESHRSEVRKVHPRDSSDHIAKAAAPTPHEHEGSLQDEESKDKRNRQRRTRRPSGSHRKVPTVHSVENPQENRASMNTPVRSLMAVDIADEIWLKPQRYSTGERATTPPPASREVNEHKPDYQPVLDGSKLKKPPVPQKPPKLKEWSSPDDDQLPVYICEKQLFSKACKPDCKDYHCEKRYAWFAHVDGTWYQFDDKEEEKLENAYFNPVETSWHVQIKGTQAILDFDTMEASLCDSVSTSLKVRRLVPKSSKWQWYLSKRQNQFSELSENLSDLFEHNYSAKRDSFQFQRASGKTFLVNFMKNTLTILTNMEDDIPFTGPIRRRPKIC